MYTRIGILGRARQAIGITRLYAPREALYIDVKYNSLTRQSDIDHITAVCPADLFSSSNISWTDRFDVSESRTFDGEEKEGNRVMKACSSLAVVFY